MVNRKFFLLSAVLYFFIIDTANAQDSSINITGNKWTLQQCIEYAKAHNVQTNTNRLNKRLAEQDLLLAGASKLPNLSANIDQNLGNGNNFNTLTGNLQNKTTLSGNYSVTSSATLYKGNYINNDIKQRRVLLDVSNLNIEESENDITLQVTQAFLNILITKESIVYLQELLSTSAQQVKRQEQLLEAGSIARKDLVQMQAQFASDKYELVTAQNNYRSNTLALRQLLLLPPQTPIEIAFPDSVNVEKMYPALNTVLSVALQNRPEVKSGQLSVDAASLEIEKARAGLRPTVIANGGLSSGYSHQSGKYITQLDNNFFQQLGLTLSIPIFDRRATKTAVERGKISVEQTQLNFANTKTVLSQQVEQAYINVQNSEGQYDAAVEELAAAKESYRISNEQFKEGAVNTVELLLQKNLYMQALQSYIQAKYSAVLYLKIYTFYMGEPITL